MNDNSRPDCPITRHTFAKRDDFAGYLMTQDRPARCVIRRVMAKVNIGLANPRRSDFKKRFAGFGNGNGDRFHGDNTGSFESYRFHGP